MMEAEVKEKLKVLLKTENTVQVGGRRKDQGKKAAMLEEQAQSSVAHGRDCTVSEK